MKFSFCVVLAVALIATVMADTYMQGMHGSNCRNREKNQNRTNANRCFNTQNNAAGGYGIHVERLQLYAGSTVMLDWTVQHGSGRGEQKADFIIQALWASDQGALAGTVRDNELGGDGQDTDQIAVNTGAALAAAEAEADNAGNADRCRYESVKSFWHCNRRQRNTNLFTGNNTPAGNTAQSTRQNDNNIHGLECTEEREYYPYWHPSDFRDIAVYMSNVTDCDFVAANSQNVVGKHLCIGDNTAGDQAPSKNNEAECAGVGTWTEIPAWGIDPPACFPAFMSRINHLGNTCGEGLPELERFNWTIPADMSGLMQVRQRYNISVDELPDWADASDDGNALLAQNNPTADIGEGITLQLTFNTAQIFRTFQDRSSLAEVLPPAPEMAQCAKTHVVKTRGGRGNIVQAYPGTEYDFAPDRLVMEHGDCFHLTWSGTDAWTANDEGQGDDEDHFNFVGMASLSALHPLAIADHVFPPAQVFQSQTDRTDWIKKAATGCSTDPNYGDTQQDNVPYACSHAVLGPFQQDLSASAFCTRNTNFSNRSQKFSVSVVSSITAFGTASILVGVFVLGAGVVAAGSMFYAKGHPNSAVARIFQNGGSRGSGILSSNGSHGAGSRGAGGSHGSRGGGGRSSRSGSKGRRSHGSKGSGFARH